jgi:branched-chain amino acid transport system permease protein
MIAVDIILSGLILGAIYAMVALGLTLQYGVARIINLAYGEVLLAGAFGAYWLYSAHAVSPLVGIFLLVPVAFVVNWAVYRFLLTPLVSRAKHREQLEGDSILFTFGLLFILQGVGLAVFGGGIYGYPYLQTAVDLFGTTVAANRLLAAGIALAIGLLLYLGLTRTRVGMAFRAVTADPRAARLVAIDVPRLSGIAFAAGGALCAAAGVLISMSQTFTVSGGVIFTMKALVIVIMGGVGNLAGTLIAGLILGVVEVGVMRLIDPGLTLAANFLIFLAVLIFRPTGIFGRSA